MENSSFHWGTRAKSAIRALDVLDALVKTADGATFAELQRSLGFPKSSLHELLSVLVSRGYVDLDLSSKAYMLGIRVWENGQAYLQHHTLLHEARPVMDRIVEQLNETVQLATLDGLENVYLAKVDCSHPIRLASEVGKRLFAHATGLGKAQLAYLPQEVLTQRLKGQTLPRFTANTIVDPAALMEELDAIRERGFAIDGEEYAEGLECLAVPIHDHSGRVSAAISASIPTIRATIDQESLALRLLVQGSLDISRRIGCGGDDPRLTRLLDRRYAELMLQRGRERVSSSTAHW
jgi:DNA-binding IclR family transcriptional regulator